MPRKKPAPMEQSGSSSSLSSVDPKTMQRRIRRGSALLSQGSSRRLLGDGAPTEVPKSVVAGAWTEHTTDDGATYYYNAASKKTTWDTPTDYALREVKKISPASRKAKWFWVKDDVHCYVAAMLIKEGGYSYKTLDGRVLEISNDNDILERIQKVDAVTEDMDDMVKMELINEASVLHNLRLRAERDEYFTNVGTILISVNPFKWLDHLYTADKFEEYRDRMIGEQIPPHFFEISDNAYRGMREDKHSQCIIISGESGAGKTEATKKCLQFLADVAGSKFGLENKLLATNPILEAFGNAKTLRNGNSSRFGKWTSVTFDANGRISGGKVVNYLLEKSRVGIQMEGERNYHIFYQMIKGASEEQRDKYCLPKACSSMEFLSNNGGSMDVPGVDDSECFLETQDALLELEFGSDVDDSLFKTVSGLLWLGNIKFETPIGGSADDAGIVKLPESDHAINCVCELLQLERAALLENLMNKIRTMGGQVIPSPLNAKGCAESCSALAREIYGRVFDWIVRKINEKLQGENASSSSELIIGVLDIFGFEIFQHNSFEQLCINFTNEKLQQHFNNHTFKTEQVVYESEGIKFTPPVFRDNADVLDLLERRPQGLFVLLDEECSLPRGSDTSYFNKITKFHNENNRFSSGPKLKAKSKLSFAVTHYAGLVVYDTEGFWNKNKDDLRENLVTLIRSSTSPFVSEELFVEAVRPGSSSGKRRHKTQAGFFRKQLEELMGVLNVTDPHYIRCIKPNNLKSSDRFDPFLCLEQLRYSGVFEAIEIRKQGFPFRRAHEQFYKRYRCLATPYTKTILPFRGDFSTLCPKVIQIISDSLEEKDKDLESCKMGRTMVLYRAPAHFLLESLREKVQYGASITINKVLRGRVTRRRTEQFRKIKADLLESIESRNVERIQDALAKSRATVSPPYSLYKELQTGEELLQRIQNEIEVCRGIEELQHLLEEEKGANVAVVYYDDIQKVLRKVEEMEIKALYPQYVSAVDDLEERIVEVRRFMEAKEQLQLSMKTGIKEDLVEAIREVQALQEESSEDDDFCVREIEDAKVLLNRVVEEEKMCNALIAGLKNGTVTGKIGYLNISSIDHKTLRSVLNDSTASSSTFTPRTKALIEYVERVITLRAAMQEKDFDTVEGVLSQIEENQDEEIDYKFPSEEVDLCREELNCYTIVEELRQSCKHGRIQGKVGALDCSSTSTTHLKQDIDDAKLLACPSRVSDEVIRQASVLLSLRENLMISDWAAVKDIMDSNDSNDSNGSEMKKHEYTKKFFKTIAAEIGLVEDELFDRRIKDETYVVLEKGNVHGSVGGLVAKGATTKDMDKLYTTLSRVLSSKPGAVYPTKESEDLMSVCSSLSTIRTAVLSKSAKTSTGKLKTLLIGTLATTKKLNKKKKPKKLVPDACIQELELILKDIVESECIEILKEGAKKDGRVKGKVGSIDLTKLSVESLKEAVDACKKLWKEYGMTKFAESATGETLLASVQDLVKLRQSLKKEDWDSVEEILAQSTVIHQVPCMQDEIQLIQQESNNKIIVQELSKAISQGKPIKGEDVGELDLSQVEVGSLRDDINDSKELGCVTKEAKDLLSCATLVADLREALVEARWDRVEKVLSDSKFTTLVPIAKDEFELVQMESNNRKIIHALEQGLENGGPTGTLEELRVDTISFHVMDEALDLAQSLKCCSKKSQHLYSACKIIRAARAAMAEGRFLQLMPLVEEAERQSLLHVENHDVDFDETKYNMIEKAHQELNLIRDKYEDEEMKNELSKALAQGKVGGRCGALELSSVKIRDLLKLITKYSMMEPKTEKAKRLLVCSELVVSVREALMSGPDWDEVQLVITSLSTENMMKEHGFDRVNEIEGEVELILGELEHREITKLLTDGLEQGCIQGSIGALDLTSLSVENLNSAIEQVKKMKCKTPETVRLFNTAEVMREIRLCVLEAKKDEAASWLGPVQVALDKAHSVGVSQVAKDELKLVQEHVDDLKITKELCAALSQGAIHGEVGNTDAHSCETERMVSALQCAHTLVCKTERARKLEKTCKVVLQLRQGLLDQNPAEVWNNDEFVKSLERSLMISVRGGTPPDNFRAYSDEAVAEFQRIVDEVRERQVKLDIRRGLESGCLSGQPGNLQVGDLETVPLAKAIEYGGRIETNLSQRTKDSCRLAKTMLQIREALKHGGTDGSDIATVSSILPSLPASLTTFGDYSILECTLKEVELARDHINNHLIIEKLREEVAKSSGGNPIRIDDIEIQPLSSCLKLVNTSLGGARSQQAREMMEACELLLNMRTHLVKRDFESVRMTIQDGLLSCAGVSTLGEEAQQQVYRARSLLVNYDIVKGVESALKVGNVLDFVEDTATRAVSGEALIEPMRKANQQVGGELDPSVAVLLEVCQLVREMRNSFKQVAQISLKPTTSQQQQENWSHTSTVLLKYFNKYDQMESDSNGAEDWKGEQGETVERLLKLIHSEFLIVNELCDDHRVYNLLHEAMNEGHLQGTVGSVSTAMLNASSLEIAVESVEKSLRHRSEVTIELLKEGKMLLSLRKSVLKDDWQHVYELTRRLFQPEFYNQVQKDKKKASYWCEFDLAWEEAKRRVVVDELTSALSSGGVEGEVGSLSTQHITVGVLNKAISKALEIGVKSEDAQQLVLAAHTVKQIRNGILAAEEEGGGNGHVNCPLVREALRMVRDEGIHSLPDVTHREILLVQNELEDQDSAKVLADALRKSEGDDSKEVVDVFDVEELSVAIARTQPDRCHTIFTKALYKVAFLMRDLRTSILESSWANAGKAVTTIDAVKNRVRQGDAPVSTQEGQNKQWRAALMLIEDEVEKCRDVIENNTTVCLFREAMLKGQAPGKFGYLRTDKLELRGLDKAIEHAVDVGCKTEEATVLYKSARLLRQLRSAVLDEDYVTASVIVSEALSYALGLVERDDNGDRESAKSRIEAFQRLPVAGNEFELFYHEIQNKLVCRALRTGLKSGQVTGSVGAVSVTESHVSGLEKATKKASQLVKTTDETLVLIHSCNVILKLRQILMETPSSWSSSQQLSVVRMWDAAQDIIAGAVANAPGHQRSPSFEITTSARPELDDMPSVASSKMKSFNLLWCHPDARDELILLLDEIQHREAVQRLLAAVSTGSAKFLGGFVDVSTVKTGALQAAISNAKLVPTRTEELTCLQLSATALLRCREALMDGSWQDLKDILIEIGRIEVHESALDEVNLLRREVHLHSVIKAVLLNLQEASNERDIAGLEAALREADSLRLSSSPDLHVLARVNKARELLEKLVVVDGKLERSLKKSDLHGLEVTLEEAETMEYKPKAFSLASEMKNKMQTMFQKSEEALVTVNVDMIKSVLEQSKREGINLPRGDEMRRILAYPPSQLERMRLNAAVERGDEDTIVQVTTGIKTRFFEDETTRERHRLECFAGLKSPEEYSENTGIVAMAVKNGMMSHTATPIPTSLTRLPSEPATSLAIKIFRALLGYMGDRQYSYPASLAQEILQVGLAVVELRDEIFLQIVKQLTENPSQDSRERGWLLLHLAFQTFPPSEEFENYLELWLRRKSVELRGFGGGDSANNNWATVCLYEMHKIVYRGAALQIPALDQLNHLLAQTNHSNGGRVLNSRSSLDDIERLDTPISMGTLSIDR